MIQQNAYAKINLSLEVIRRRDDGYHDIVSVMQLIDLHDTLTFVPSGEVSVRCEGAELEPETNLVWRAARLLQDAAGITVGATIVLTKRIPLAAGLGGGSSDAAATLVGLSRFWGLDLSWETVHELAGKLGSDVPFFLDGPTALVEGRGERVSSLPSPPPGWALLANPSYSLADKTRRLYESLDKRDLTDGTLTRRLIASLLEREFPVSRLLYNAFERSAYEEVFDGLKKVRERVARAAGGRDVHLSGSGPTLYVLFPQAEELRARAAYETLQAEGLTTFLTRTLSGTP